MNRRSLKKLSNEEMEYVTCGICSDIVWLSGILVPAFSVLSSLATTGISSLLGRNDLSLGSTLALGVAVPIVVSTVSEANNNCRSISEIIKRDYSDIATLTGIFSGMNGVAWLIGKGARALVMTSL